MADPIIHVPTKQELRKVVGGRDGRYPFLEMNTFDWLNVVDADFARVGNLDSALFTDDKDLTASADIVESSTQEANGTAVIKAGTDDNAQSGMYGPFVCKGDLNCVIAVRVQYDVVTTLKTEIGFTDAIDSATIEAGANLVLATPTWTADDAATWIVDTDDTANWQFHGVKATTGTAKTEPGSPPVAATFETLVVALQGDSIRGYRLNAAGKLLNGSDTGWIANGIEGGTLLYPYLMLQSRSAAAHIAKLDFFKVWQRRA